MTRRRRPAPDARAGTYHDWQTTSVSVRGRPVALVFKPGMAAADAVDIGARLLAEQVTPGESDTVLDLNCGAGLAGTVAAALAPRGRVLMADRSIVAVEAARRTLAAGGIANATVHHSDGTSHLSIETPADTVMVRIPKEKAAALQLVWDAFNALRPGGRLFLAGAGDEGINPLIERTRELFGSFALLAYKKGARVGSARRPPSVPELPEAFRGEWLDHQRFIRFDVELRGRTFRVCSRPGVFSYDRLDEGTRVLAETMQIGPRDTVLDLGCGNGILGTVAGALASEGQVHMVDADVTALECARRTAEANSVTNCTVVPSDGAGAIKGLRFDRVVTNPPFHAGKGTQYHVAAQFVKDAAAVLRPGGRFYLVANRFLPYERMLQETFGGFETAIENPGYKVLAATSRG